jgi:hypothetical protein
MVRFTIAASAANAQIGPVCDGYCAKADDCIERLPEFMQEDPHGDKRRVSPI